MELYVQREIKENPDLLDGGEGIKLMRDGDKLLVIHLESYLFGLFDPEFIHEPGQADYAEQLWNRTNN